MSSEPSLVRFAVMNFWAVLIQTRPFQPISTLLMKLVEALVNAEQEPDLKIKKRLAWIYEHTHNDIDAHLSVVELVVFRNLDKGISKELTIGDNDFELSTLYFILDEITKELSNMVIMIAKKYNMDIPDMNYGSAGGGVQKISFEN